MTIVLEQQCYIYRAGFILLLDIVSVVAGIFQTLFKKSSHTQFLLNLYLQKKKCVHRESSN